MGTSMDEHAAKMHVKGKFLFCGEEKFYIKGVTYGTFAPDDNDCQFPDISTIEKDFTLMAMHGINCIRTYTVPPIHLLDIADSLNLKVMVGLPWEQHITFLDNQSTKTDIIRRVKEGVISCNKHAAILCYTIGNEIPPSIVRWYGKNKIERFLKTLYNEVKKIDPDSLVTYVNYPTTEFLDLSFLDFDCFNVYLETPEKLGSYIARLHNLCGDRPLVLAEIGLDSNRNGVEKQAEIITWQIETIFAKGAAGMFVFAWTDEWWRGGFEIEDWDFGLVDRERNPKPALFSVSSAMNHIPFAPSYQLPLISVIVCSYNGSATIRDTLEGVLKIDYPNYEVIVVNDGSNDHTAKVIQEYPVKLITSPNRGLSSARNTGMNNAKGEILAYIDDDAYPDPQWLRYLAYAYSVSDHGCIGGPNIAPAEDGFIATCVANSPGGPVHVLVSDEIAEHVPGCNMSFKRDALMKIGGFDPVYRNAGDDVDVCWRIQESGRTIGFHPSALVWHHRRNSLKAYWKQQKGYGKAEALLEAKWPEKYNGFGHLTWAGRIYGNGITLPIKVKKDRIFHGTWGTALFQSVYQPAEGFLNSIPLMPEWYLFVGSLAFLSALGFLWSPLLWAIPVLVAAIVVIFVQAIISAYKNTSLPRNKRRSAKYIALISALHIVQPMARLFGRVKHGLAPWRKRPLDNTWKFRLPLRFNDDKIWSEKWRAPEEWLMDIEETLIKFKTRVKRGGDFDKWDLQMRNGISSVCRAIFTIEEHGAGKQLLKMKTWTRPSKTFIIAFGFFSALAAFAALSGALIVSITLSLFSFLFFIEYLLDTSITMHHFKQSLLEVGNRWNELESEPVVDEEQVVIDDILSGNGKTIVLVRNDNLQVGENSNGFELAKANN